MTKRNNLGSMSVPIDAVALAQALADGATVMVAKDMITEKFVRDRADAMGDWIAGNTDKWSFLKKPVPDGHDELACFCSELGEFLAALQEPTKGWFPLISVSLSDMDEFCGPYIYKSLLASVLARPGTHVRARESLAYSASARIVDAAYTARAHVLSEKRICVKDIHVFRAATCLLDIRWLSEVIIGAKALSVGAEREVSQLEAAVEQAYRSLIQRCLV